MVVQGCFARPSCARGLRRARRHLAPYRAEVSCQRCDCCVYWLCPVYGCVMRAWAQVVDMILGAARRSPVRARVCVATCVKCLVLPPLVCVTIEFVLAAALCS
jgi:hypothetical protein